MTEPDPTLDPDKTTPEVLRRRQEAEELAEREAQAGAASEAETLTHERRVDKARYLREKLEAQRRADDDESK